MRALVVMQRASMLALIGIVAGGVHSVVRPVTLTPAASIPVPIPDSTSTPGGGTTVPPPVASSDGSAKGAGLPTSATGTPAPLGLELTLAQSFDLYQKGAPFLDARTKQEFEEGHVEGAFHLSSEHFMGGATPDALNFLDPKAPVVVYCGGGQCDASKNLVILLQQAGFTQCHIMHDGYPGWLAAGHAVAKGAELGEAPKK
jgi:rhodanese-related sulfurtransferase